MLYEVGFKEDRSILVPGEVIETLIQYGGTRDSGVIHISTSKEAKHPIFSLNLGEVLYIVPIDEGKMRGVNLDLEKLLKRQLLPETDS